MLVSIYRPGMAGLVRWFGGVKPRIFPETAVIGCSTVKQPESDMKTWRFEKMWLWLEWHAYLMYWAKAYCNQNGLEDAQKVWMASDVPWFIPLREIIQFGHPSVSISKKNQNLTLKEFVFFLSSKNQKSGFRGIGGVPPTWSFISPMASPVACPGP